MWDFSIDGVDKIALPIISDVYKCGAYVAGGVVRAWELQEKTSDIDIYLVHPEQFFTVESVLIKHGFSLHFQSSLASTYLKRAYVYRQILKSPLFYLPTSSERVEVILKVQIITNQNLIGKPKHIISRFDMTVAQAQIVYEENMSKPLTLWYHPQGLYDCYSKRMVIATRQTHSADQLIRRILKYTKRYGFKFIPMNQYQTDIARTISLGGANIDRLESQIGDGNYDFVFGERVAVW